MVFAKHLTDEEIRAFLAAPGDDPGDGPRHLFLELRERMLRFSDLQEQVTDPAEKRIAYISKCNRFAELRLTPRGLEADVLVGREQQSAVLREGLATAHPSGLRASFGWVRTRLAPGEDPGRFRELLRRAYKWAFTTPAPTDKPRI